MKKKISIKQNMIDLLSITFVKKKKNTKEVKVIPSEPLIDFEKNFIEKK